MSEWITDRAPTEADGFVVYRADGMLVHFLMIPDGEAWKPVAKIEPYVKPKRWVAESAKYSRYHDSTDWRVRNTKTGLLLNLAMDTEEQARKFADFLNEVMP